MIIGKDYQEKFDQEQKKLRVLKDQRKKVFALLPLRLADGRYAWLSWVYKQEHVATLCNGDLKLFKNLTDYYETKDCKCLVKPFWAR